MLILDLTVSVKPKKVLDWRYVIYPPSLVCKQPNGSLCLNVQIMCGVKLNLKKYYLHDKLPNESIILMLSTAKILK